MEGISKSKQGAQCLENLPYLLSLQHMQLKRWKPIPYVYAGSHPTTAEANASSFVEHSHGWSVSSSYIAEQLLFEGTGCCLYAYMLSVYVCLCVFMLFVPAECTVNRTCPSATVTKGHAGSVTWLKVTYFCRYILQAFLKSNQWRNYQYYAGKQGFKFLYLTCNY